MSTTNPSVWTAPKLTLLRTLWAEGLPATQIGERLCVSKSAVIGKVHRLCLPGRPSPLGVAAHPVARPRKAANAAPPASARPAKPTLPTRHPKDTTQPRPPVARVVLRATQREPAAALPTPAESPPTPRPRLDPRAQSCRWPSGEPGQAGFHFRGEPAEPGKPYCALHCKRAYRLVRAIDAAGSIPCHPK